MVDKVSIDLDRIRMPKVKRTLGQELADKITGFGGSWIFIILIIIFLLTWTVLNVYILKKIGYQSWDKYPFVLLNLILGCLAVIQAPIILMSQKRQGEKDRLKAGLDFKIDKKSEREIEEIQKELKEIKRLIKKK